MARTNRLVVADGWYHITARAHGRMFLLEDPEFKSRIVRWIYGIADFAGVEVGAWTLMDSHVHLLVRVPPVPGRYCANSQPSSDSQPSPAGNPPAPAEGTVPPAASPAEGTVPASWAFGMRPAECRAPRWLPASDGVAITPAGDSPSREAFVRACSDGVPLVVLPRPEVGFSLTDDEMLERLARLYDGHSRGAQTVARKWRRMRLAGLGHLVEEEKERFCRRMYNVSQYAKTLFQRISETYNRETGHTGHFWEGRFRSVLVDPKVADRLAVSGYIALNPVRARMTASPADYAFSSYAQALRGDGPWSGRCRRDCERAFGCGWDEVDARLQAYFADRLPPELEGVADCTDYEEVGPDGKARRVPLRIAQAVHVRQRAFTCGAVFTHSLAFAKSVRAKLPKKFPATGDWAAERLAGFDWRMRPAA